MKRRIVKAVSVLALLGSLYFGINYAVEFLSKNSARITSIAKGIDDKYNVTKSLQEIIESAESFEEETVLQFKESEIGQGVIKTTNSIEEKITSLLGKNKTESPKTYPDKKIILKKMNPVFLHGKCLDDYFREFDEMIPEQQEYLAKTLNSMSVWDIVLLSRYAPIDGILRSLSSFYSTDYKWHLQCLFSESVLDPTAVGPTNDKGLGQVTPESEKWARGLYKKGYKFPGQEITNNIFDPYTNLVLSSIIYRKSAEEKVLDLDALYSLYTNGFKGVERNKDGFYAINEFGLGDVERAKRFDYLTDKLIIFSWLSMERSDLGEYIEDEDIRKLIETNNSSYDFKIAYSGMINLLNSESNKEKYSEENADIFRTETLRILTWLKELYNSAEN